MCDKCPFTTNLEEYLKIHASRKHSDKTNLNIICDKCGFKTNNKYDLNRHRWKEHGKGIHYKDKSSRPLRSCSHCQASFDNYYDFSEHIKVVHEKLNLIQCDQCTHKFETQGKLNKHIRNFHNPVCCDICAVKLSNVFKLEKHKAKFHDVVPDNSFKCDQCPSFFRKEKNLQIHVKNEHL